MFPDVLARRAAIKALIIALIGCSAAPAAAQVFYYGEIVDINPGSRVFTVRGDDKSKSRFQVTPETKIRKDIHRPVAAGFQDLALGTRVRVLVGWAPATNPAVRQAVTILVYE